MFTGLRSRIILLVLLAFLPALALTIWTGVEQRRHTAADAQGEALRLARLAANNQATMIEGGQQLLVALAHLPAIRQGDLPACEAFLASLLQRYAYYVNLGVAAPNGDLLCSAVPPSGPVSYADREWLQQAVKTRNFVVGQSVVGRVTGKALLPLAYPELDQAGQVQYVVFSAIDLGWLNRLVAQVQLPEGSVLTVIDSQGTVLARYPDPQSWVGQTLPETPIVGAILARGGEGTAEAIGVDGVSRLYAFTPLGEEGETNHQYVSIGIPAQVAFAEANRLFVAHLASLGLVTLVAVAVAWGFGHVFIVRRVDALLQATQRLASGDLQTRTGMLDEKSELGLLAQAFDGMAGALERREAERKRAQEELVQVNRALQTISECNQALVRAEDEVSLLHQICRILVTVGGYLLAWVDYVDQDIARLVLPVAQAGDEEGFLEKLHLAWADAEPGPGPIGVAIRTGTVCKINDLQSSLAFEPWRSDAIQRGYSAFIALPLTDNGKVFSTLNIFAGEAGAFGEQEESLLRELADDLAYGILSLRTRSAHQLSVQALRESEAHYRSTLDNMLEGCQIIGFDWRYLYVNDAVVKHGRRAKQDLLGHKITQVYPGIEKTDMFAALQRCMDERIPSHMENEFVYPDGATGWFELGIQPVPEGVFILSVDITERKQAEKVQAAIYQISQAAVSSQSTDELYRSIHHILGELMPVENFYIAEHDPATDLLSFPYFVDQFDLPSPPQKAGRGLTEYVLRTGRSLLASPQVFHQLVEQGEVELVGTDSVDWLGVPLKTEERVIGVMVAQSYTEGVRYSQKDKDLFEFVSTQIAQVIERKRAEERIRQNAKRAQTLADISRVIVEASLDYQDILEAVVKNVSEGVGDACVIALTSEDGAWLNPVAFYHPDPEARVILGDLLAAEPVRLGEGTSGRVAQTGQPVLIQDVPQEQNGEVIRPAYSPYLERYGVSSLLIVPLRSQGRVIGTLGVTRDQPGRPYTDEDQAFLQEIGDRTALAIFNARLFEQEQARSRELDTLNSLSSVLREALTTDEMLPVVLRETRRFLRADSAMFMLRHQGNSHLRIVLADGHIGQNSGRIFGLDEGLCRIVFDSRRPFVTADYAAEPQRLPDLSHGDKIGPAAFIPLASEVEMLGVLMVARQRNAGAQAFSPAEVRLLTTIGEMVGNALRRAFLFEETQRRLSRVQALRKIDVAITNAMDLHVSIDVILEQITAQTGVDAACVLLFDSITHTLNFAAGRGFRSDALQYTDLRLGEGYAGQAALVRRIINIPDLCNRKTDFLRSPGFSAEGFVAYYAIPLIAKGQVKGVLEIFHRAPLEPNQEWLDFLETLAGQAAIAIDNATLFNDLQQSNQELVQAYDATIEGWSRALDLRDKETEGHTQRVVKMTLCLAKAMGIGESELLHIRRGALLHDIGKMGIPDQILLKPGPLTDEEWVQMRKHPVSAYEMLVPIAYLKLALEIPYCHHEKWDGTGYPRGLKGEQIPLAARIFAVADVWDALTSDRPYRKAWGKEEALAYIRDQAGRHFDPRVTETFIGLLNEDLKLQPVHVDLAQR